MERRPSGNGIEMLVNPSKVSADVMSLRSFSGSEMESDLSDQSSVRSGRSARSNRSGRRSAAPGPFTRHSDSGSGSEYGASGAGGTESGSESNYSRHSRRSGSDERIQQRARDLKDQARREKDEKRELLYKFDRLENKGVRLPRRFTMDSDLEEMRNTYDKIVRDRHTDNAVAMQKQTLMTVVSGIEFLNSQYDPFGFNLKGWSESFGDRLETMDDVLEEIYEKYSSRGKKMAPELKLMMAIAGSAFMTSMTNKMAAKITGNSDVEEIMRHDPSLRQHYEEALRNYSAQKKAGGARGGSGGGGGGIFGFLSNMLGGGGNSAPPPPPQPQPMAQRSRGGPMPAPPAQAQAQAQATMRGPANIDSILNEIHNEINVQPPTTRYETMSVTDSEITDHLEETPDIQSLLGAAKQTKRGPGRPPKNPRNTLNL